MNKKTKRRLDVLHTKLQKLQQQLAGAKKQVDEPDEVARLERELESTRAQLEELKKS